MPQLNPEFFVSQIFWLIVTFSFLLFFLWKISLPRISRVLEKRENKINNDIESAKILQTEAEQIQNGCLQDGLLMILSGEDGNVIRTHFPLSISDDDLEIGMSIIEKHLLE